jgi:hypothetical protein
MEKAKLETGRLEAYWTERNPTHPYNVTWEYHPLTGTGIDPHKTETISRNYTDFVSAFKAATHYVTRRETKRVILSHTILDTVRRT